MNRLSKKGKDKPDSYIIALNLIIAGRHAEAMKFLNAAATENYSNLDAILKLGVIHRRLGNPKRAAQIHLELTSREKQTKSFKAEIFRELALDFEQIGNFNKALKYIEEAISLETSDPVNHEVKVRLLEGLEKWQEVREAAAKWSSLTKKDEKTRLALYKIREGEALCQKGQEHNGRIAYKEALKIDSDITETYLFIADSYSREDRLNDALEWVSKFIKENPHRAELAVPMLEKLLFEAGRFDDIESIIRSTVEEAPDNRHMPAILIDLLSKKGEVEEALRLCQTLLDSGQDDLIIRIYHLH